MKTCATCRFAERIPDNMEFFRCQEIVSTYNCLGDDCPSCDPDDAFIENTGEPGCYTPELIVRGTFGCTLHEEKEG